MIVSIAHPALLPSGFTDLLPPRAAQEDGLSQALLQLYHAHGYARVNPPLLEFEDNLLAGSGAGLSAYTFRLMDPLSGQMLALRADMTVQVARIATTRVMDWPRPLRLAYAGQVVRRTNSEHRPQRQSGQIGLELIGASSAAADAEIMRLACASLLAVGIADFTLDLTLPTLVGGICQAFGLTATQTGALRQALDRKDRAAVAMIETPATPLLLQLLQLGGPMDAALAGLQALDLPGSVKAECDHLSAVWSLIKAEAFAPRTMLDLVERRGFEYNTGLGYTLFANQPGIELGRGGRYHSKARDSVEPGEPATGFTFYSENLLAAMPEPQPTLRLYLPYGTAAAQAASYHQKGFVTIAALQPDSDPAVAARAQGCTHHLHNGHPEKL